MQTTMTTTRRTMRTMRMVVLLRAEEVLAAEMLKH